MEWIEKTTQKSNSAQNNQLLHVYYRGQADEQWDLLPAVFRNNKRNDLSMNETQLLKKAHLSFARELSGYHSYLEKLVYLQHYGMKTRLLDVTFNPLIALYFACSDKKARTELFITDIEMNSKIL